MARRNGAEKEGATVKTRQTPSQLAEKFQIDKIEARIVKLQQMVERLGGEDRVTAQVVKASSSPPQKLAKLEEIIQRVEKAVKQCYSRTDMRDNQRSRRGKAKYVPWIERVKPTEKDFCRYFTIQFECERRTINPYTVIQKITEETGESLCQVTAEGEDSFVVEVRNERQAQKLLEETNIQERPCKGSSHKYYNQAK